MNYPRYQKIARDQIARYGQPVTFRFREGTPSYDPIAGEVTAAVREVECPAVLLSPEEKALSTGTVQVGDAMLLVGGGDLPQDPDETATVVLAGEVWRIVSVSRVSPAGVVILYKVFIRRS